MRPLAAAGALGLLAAAVIAGQEDLPLGTLVGNGVPAPASDHLSGYDPGGRRDPFVSLLAPTRAADVAAPARPAAGLAGVALADVSVKGIVRNGSIALALLEAPGGRSFVARRQDRLRDATVTDIDGEGVLFAQDIADAEGGLGIREVRKSLRQTTVEPAREARR